MNRAERRQGKKQETQKSNAKLFAGIAIGIIALVGGMFVLSQGNAPNSVGGVGFPTGNVHWHAYPTVEVCGEERLLPVPNPGQSHLGSPLLHTHEDRWIHVEGAVNSPQDIALGKYMQYIGVKFDSTHLMEKANGDLCNASAGKVRLFVNGTENFEFENHIIRDQEKILFKFE